ncbi:hypothetical protein CCUG63695_00340 [Mycobacteroides franklinii]|uniref:Polysaccharide chain length determinant N-terminal domain-containing protein n=1 Tax=Mycobacteroides franklinii TaxID=948102 RepID=A0A4R8R3R1_9MYCO|nr:hypothetical protein CCUG64054_00974 [Mycobacteroides franklinii]TDZ48819.1 hypothetical protein CCUG63697_03351 [Mycobacteroides franklinii]TDZ59000.1 hypothetical protein CCUG63696_00978 [Mycobacteroides franklinii]TDZ66514.1 hypothetical protein CCUG63695_00340 [Mycobacteroides franklinii]TDZ72437.1 hypothetical protein CCUG64056_00974 [Mycobacteroides franklinii]
MWVMLVTNNAGYGTVRLPRIVRTIARVGARVNVNDLVKRILNRRIALFLVVLLACGAGAYGYSTGVTVRASTASAVVVPPPTYSSTGDTLGANPMLNLSPEKAQLAGILATSLSSQPAQAAIAAVAPGVDYKVSNTIDLGPNNQQPSPQVSILVLCSATSDCQAGASALLDVARDNLIKLQVGASVSPENWASLTVLQEPTAPVVTSTSAMKSAGSMAVAALLAGLILVLIYDALAVRHRKEKSATKKNKEQIQAKTAAPTSAAGSSTQAALADEPVTHEAEDEDQPAANIKKPMTIDDDLDNVEIDDEALAQAVLNWTPPRLTDFRNWRDDKPSPDR